MHSAATRSTDPMKIASTIAVRAITRILTAVAVPAMLAVPGLVVSSNSATDKKTTIVGAAGPNNGLLGVQAGNIQSNSNGSSGTNGQPVVSVLTPLAYNSIPGTLPPNVPSLGYQANQTAEFGDLIQFAGTSHAVTHVTLVMSDWALASDWPSFNTGPTWNHPITLNLYNVDNSGANPAPGSLIATRTNTFPIPWRPVADPTCPGGTAWRAGDLNCYNGLAFTITFDFTGTTLPTQIIYGVSYNTQTWGY